MRSRRRLIVHGHVHGVGFRAAAARAASSRGVSGWVRNLPDGTVEVVLEGDEDAVASVERLCQEGPRGAAVIRVEAANEPLEGLLRFEIR